jgi:hypothetical protein
MRRTFPACLGVLAVGIAAGCFAPAYHDDGSFSFVPPTTPAVRARAWAPLVRLAAGSGPKAPAVAVARLHEWDGTVQSALQRLSVADPLREFSGKLHDGLEGFDLEGVHELLPDDEGDGWRALRIIGRCRDGKYSVRGARPGEPCACDPDGDLGSHFGDVAASFRMKPGPHDDSYLARSSVAVGIGTASWPHITAAASESIRLVESTDPAAPLEGGARASLATKDEVRRENPGLGRRSLELVALVRESFPQLYNHLMPLYRIEDVIIEDETARDYTQVHLVLSIRREPKKKELQGVVQWLAELGPLASGQLELEDDKGRTLATMDFSTKDLRVALNAFVSRGAICPVENGQVLVNDGYYPRAIARQDYRGRLNLDVTVNGITTEVHDLRFKAVYEKTADGMRSELVFDEEPTIHVRGAAYGLVPAWELDIAVPGGLEGLTRDFYRVLTKGNGGRGLRFATTVCSGKDGSTVATAESEADFLNNWIIRLGFKVANRALHPPDDVLEALTSFVKEGEVAFAKDLEAFAADTQTLADVR